ncbi:hypothetical protein D3C75_1243620 [compost metagenome]
MVVHADQDVGCMSIRGHINDVAAFVCNIKLKGLVSVMKLIRYLSDIGISV